MKKTIKIASITLGIGAIFSLGTLAGASSDWKTTAINTSYSELLSTGNKTTNDLTSNTTDDINNTVNTAIQDTVADQQKQLEELLQQYYALKLQGLTQTDSFKQLEQQIKEIQASVLANFKTQIDQKFSQAQGQ